MAPPLWPVAAIVLALRFAEAGAEPPARPAGSAEVRDPAPPAGREPVHGPAATHTPPLPPGASGDDPAASRELATEILRDLATTADDDDASAGAPTAARPSQPNARAQRRAAANAADHGADPEWRELGKSVLQWVKDRAHGFRADEPEEAPTAASTSRIEWADTGPGGSLGGGRFGGSLAGGSAHAGSPSYFPPAPSPDGRGTVLGPERNVIQEAIDAIREVLEHPMSWLVIALIGIGALWVKKFDRRPK